MEHGIFTIFRFAIYDCIWPFRHFMIYRSEISPERSEPRMRSLEGCALAVVPVHGRPATCCDRQREGRAPARPKTASKQRTRRSASLPHYESCQSCKSCQKKTLSQNLHFYTSTRLRLTPQRQGTRFIASATLSRISRKCAHKARVRHAHVVATSCDPPAFLLKSINTQMPKCNRKS